MNLFHKHIYRLVSVKNMVGHNVDMVMGDIIKVKVESTVIVDICDDKTCKHIRTRRIDGHHAADIKEKYEGAQ